MGKRFMWLLAVILVVGCSSAPPASPGASAVAGLPQVIIDSPPSGSFVAVGQTLQVSVRGQDLVGVTRLDLRVGDVLVDTAETAGGTPEPLFSAILEWTPSAEGVVTMSALAYRSNATGSAPASISLTVVPAGSVISPLPTMPSGSPAPTLGPGPTPVPTLPPASAEPTNPPRPTRAPTPEPVAANLRVFVMAEDLESLSWQVGAPIQLRVYVENLGSKDAPKQTVLDGRAAGDGAPAVEIGRNPRISPGAREHYNLRFTPERAGERTLRVTVTLPPGFYDTDPSDNVYSVKIQVRPAPTPSAAPSADPSAEPSATP